MHVSRKSSIKAGISFLAYAGIAISIILFFLGGYRVRVLAEECPHFSSNGWVSYSPDRTAFTIGYGDRSTQIYDYSKRGLTITLFGITGPEELGEGQHYFEKLVVGETRVGYWKMNHPQGQCIHSATSDYRISALDKMGSNRGNCFRFYNAGWLPFCAVCEKMAANCLFYITEQMALSTAYLPSGTAYSNYFYLCPYDNSLENYVPTNHKCIFVSDNKYKVIYNSNDSEASGSMEADWFMYNNSVEYEGAVIDVGEKLSECVYSVAGKSFLGWSNRPDGEVLFSDEQDWISVQEVIDAGALTDKSSIRLYAVWEQDTESESVVETKIIDVDNTFGLSAYIVRNLRDKDMRDSFIRGEAGTLYIYAEGDIDYLSVEFPKEMNSYSAVLDYTDEAENFVEETVEFVIPLTGIPDETDSICIKVTAYKEEKVVSCYPMAVIIPGQSILDGLRTGLR